MNKEFLKLIDTAFNAAMAYRDTKDDFFYKTGRKAVRILITKYRDILEVLPCENKFWIAFSFAATMFK